MFNKERISWEKGILRYQDARFNDKKGLHFLYSFVYFETPNDGYYPYLNDNVCDIALPVL